MTIKNVVAPSNLGATIKANHLAPNKYDVQIDKDTLKANASGVVAVNTAPMGSGGSAALQAMVQALETTTSLTYNPATKTLTHTNEDGTVSNIDLSALAVDVNLSSGSYDPATMVLTLTDSDSTTVTINLAELKKVESQASNSISVAGTGEASNKLIYSLVIDPLATNLLKVTAAGTKVDAADISAAILTVDVQDAFGVHLYTAGV